MDASSLRGRVDIVCGGFPCQDISLAGKGGGLEGARSGLFYELMRVVREVGPRLVFLENTPGIRRRGLGAVLGELAACGFDAEWHGVEASDAGAPHRRFRVFILAKNTGGFGG
jgi:DNA (cytosine-5)-methyltransferase 1